MKRVKNPPVYGFVILISCLIACAPTKVKDYISRPAEGVTKPSQILVMDFTVDPEAVIGNKAPGQKIIDAVKGANEDDKRDQIIKDVVNELSEDIVEGIGELGFTAVRADQKTQPAPGVFVIEGTITNIDEGDRMKRVVVGFGLGESVVNTQVQIFAVTASGKTKLMEFSTEARSAPMPGAAVTMGAGAAAQGGVTATSAAVAAGTSGVKEWKSSVEEDASRTAEQIVAFMSEYFGREGWIPPEKVKKAKTE